MIQLLPIIGAIGTAFRVPALATFLAGLAGTIVAFFASFVAKRTAIQLGIVASVVTLTLAVFASIKLILAGVSVVTPPEMTQAFSMITPSNFWPCVSAVYSAKIIRWVWTWKVHFIEMYANGS